MRRRLAEPKQELEHNSEDLPQLEILTSTVSDWKYKLALSQSKIQYVKKKLLASSTWLEKSAIATAIAEQVASDLRKKVHAFKEKSKGLWTALQDLKTALADHVAMATEKIALAYIAKLKPQDELSSLSAQFESYCPKRRKKLDFMTIFSEGSQARLA